VTIFRARGGAQQVIHARYCIVCATLRASFGDACSKSAS
jgi:hypothetical protein